MNCKHKKLALLLSIVLMLSGCASTRPPSSEPVRIQPPPAELMAPLPVSPVNVDKLLLRWTNMIEDWQQQLQLCKSTPRTCA